MVRESAAEEHDLVLDDDGFLGYTAADRFAKLVVWELFQPVINSVTTGYSLTVELR